LSRLMYYDLKVPLVDDLLMKVDKMTMAASLEARCPYLDYRLVHFARDLPMDQKLNSEHNKLILRSVMENILPEEISHRSKHPFHVSIRRWLLNELRDFFWDSTGSARFRELELVDESGLHHLWQDLEANVPGRAPQLWTLLSIASWMEIYKVTAGMPVDPVVVMSQAVPSSQ
jgi:asparagine synthase (glutamine-hydrolysing)